MDSWILAPELVRASSLVNAASGLTVLLLGLQAYWTLRPTSSKHRELTWAWTFFLLSLLLLGSGVLLAGLKGLADQFSFQTRGLSTTASCLQAAFFLVLPLWVFWLPPLSHRNPYRASSRREPWSINYLIACVLLLAWLGRHPALLRQLLVLAPVIFLVCALMVCRKLQHPGTNESTARLAWAIVPLVAYPGLQLPSLMLTAWSLKLQVFHFTHLHILLALLAILVGLPCAWFWVLYRSRLRHWHGYGQFHEWVWFVPVVVLITQMQLTGLPALTPVSSAFYNAVFPIGMAYALGGRPFRASSRPNLRPWIWTFLATSLAVVTAAVFVLQDASAFVWVPILAAFVALPCWLMLRLRRAMQWFGAGAGWWPPHNRTGQWLP